MNWLGSPSWIVESASSKLSSSIGRNQLSNVLAPQSCRRPSRISVQAAVKGSDSTPITELSSVASVRTPPPSIRRLNRQRSPAPERATPRPSIGRSCFLQRPVWRPLPHHLKPWSESIKQTIRHAVEIFSLTYAEPPFSCFSTVL